VVIELKRGNNKLQLLQAISYAGMISQWSAEEFLGLLSTDQKETMTSSIGSRA
jgi:hypothetical protein